MEARYPIMPKEQSRRIRAEIRRVFLDIWDPIRIGGEPDGQDEYDGYLGRAFELLTSGATDQEIEEYLLWILGRMGMDGSRVSLKNVVKELRGIDLS